MEALKCPNCKKIFNSESRLAKFSGKCGQSICSECLNQIIESSMKMSSLETIYRLWTLSALLKLGASAIQTK